MRPPPTREGLRRYRLLLREQGSAQPLAARVRVTDAAGATIAPVGHRADPIGPDGTFYTLGKPGDVLWHGPLVWAYLDGQGFIDLDDGPITIQVEKGPEYVPLSLSLDPTTLPDDCIVLVVERWADWPSQGWYAGDCHVHEPDPASLLVEARAEDVNVTSILVANSGASWLAFPFFRPGLHPMSDAEHLLQYGQEYRHNRLGHITFLGINATFLPQPRRTPPRLAATDWPSLSHLAQQVQADGGVVVWAHWPWPAGECAVAVALGLVDAFEPLGIGEPLRARDDMDKHYPLLDSTLREFAGRSVYDLAPLEHYYAYLSLGFEIGLAAGSDKYTSSRIIGAARVYAHVAGELTYAKWLAALKVGQTFVTSGPLVSFTVDGQPVGSRLTYPGPGVVRVVAEASSAPPYTHLEIIVNGEVVHSAPVAGTRHTARIEADVAIETTSWLAARCVGDTLIHYGPLRDTKLPIMAHTSPIYLSLPQRPLPRHPKAAWLLDQVAYLKTWITERAEYDTDIQRETALAQADAAERVLRARLGLD